MSIYKIEQKNSFNKKFQQLIPKLPQAAQDYLLSQINHLEASTRYGYASNYLIFFSFVCEKISRFTHLIPSEMTLDDLKNISHTEIDYFKDYYSVDHSTYALNRILSSLSSLYNFYIRQYVLEVNPIISVKRSIPKKLQLSISQDDVTIILSNAINGNFLSGKALTHHTRLKARDYAILRLITDLGLSVSDICGLNIKDIDIDNNTLWLFSSKNGWSVLHFTDDLKAILADYSEYRHSKNHLDEDAYFIQRDGKRLSQRSIELIVKKYCSTSSELASMTPRKLRSFAIN